MLFTRRLAITGDCEWYINSISSYESYEIKNFIKLYNSLVKYIMLSCIEASSNLLYAFWNGLAVTFKLCTFIGKRIKPFISSLL
ncbi:hypothetical protein H8356DRAFT_1418610 [Neocallimastix lanati (nom. inval.)]|nr:hypothetical protein H8356DRAFT_1418610 [Neocallimastix sp. JGI-2020a]